MEDTVEKVEMLYRYRPVDEDSLENRLSEIKGNMWCATPESLNDPFDGLGVEEMEPGYADYPHAHKSETVRVKFLKYWLVSCFSDSWERPPMWAHYSDYSGICLAYDFEKLKECVRTGRTVGLPGLGLGLEGRLEKVQYAKDFPVSGDPNALFVKTDDWSYEHEWRLVIQEVENKGEDKHGVLISTEDCLSEIMLGPRLEKKFKDVIIDAGKSLGRDIGIYQVELVPGKAGYNRTPV
jgi:hypothetical protein